MAVLPKKSVTVHPPLAPLRGRIRLPGSKSITNRALLLAALAKGSSRLTGALNSDDTVYMAGALRRMGVAIDQEDEETIIVNSEGRLKPPDGPLFLGNAGTAMRFLTAASALVDGPVRLDGDEHMRRRPIAPLIEALRALGVEARDTNGCPPVDIHGSGGFPAHAVVVDGRLSSQYVSAIMMAAPGGAHPITLEIADGKIGARGYIDITLAMMKAFGAVIEPIGDLSWRIEASGYKARDYAVEPDASAATYFWAAEKLTGGQIDLGVKPGDMMQPDARAYAIISRFPHLPAAIDGSQIQDAVPTLAVLAAFNETPVRFTGIANLRVKECDRVSAVAAELCRIRPDLAREDGDDLIVNADPSLAGQTLPADIHTYADHRIAMSFALAGLRIHGIRILDRDCVAKTFPCYWQALEALQVSLEFE